MKKLITVVVVIALVSFCFAEEPALTVNGAELGGDFVKACMFLTFSSYDDTVRYYSSTLGIDYWSLEYEDGSTVFDRVKADGFKSLVMQTMLCSDAAKLGISLDDAKMKELKALAETMSSEGNMDPEIMLEALSARELSQRVYGALVSIQNIDAAAVLETVNESDYSNQIQYLYVPYSAYFENYEAKIEYSRLLTSLSRFEGDYNQAVKLVPDVDCGILDLSGIDGNLTRVVNALPEGGVSDVIETELGLFMLRSIADDDRDEYRLACEQAIYAAKESTFQAEYEKIYRGAEYTLDNAFWDSLTPPEAD